jgi:DNA-binding XRE family transcriptional regulator
MNKLKEFRERYKLTQEDLAQKLKIDRSSVAKWESGENSPRLKYLFAMSKIFQCKIEDLIQFEEVRQNGD